MIFPISILYRVTPGLVLNVLVIGFLTILAVLAAIGEFVIRNFVQLQNAPAFIIRKIYEKNLKNKLFIKSDSILILNI